MTAHPTLRRNLAFWPLPLIVIAATALVAGIRLNRLSFSGKPSLDGMVVIIAAELALAAWLMCLSGMPVGRRIRWLYLLFGIELIPPLLWCISGFNGDAQPRVDWRWAISSRFPAEEAAEGITPRPADRPAAGVDLSQTTPCDYPAFRGRDRSGTIRNTSFATDWDQSPPRLLWRQAVGAGWSSFAVVGDYCVTQEQRGEDEAVVCYELRTGRQCWQHREKGRFHEMMGGEGPRATPTIEQGRVYALGATGTLVCLDGRDGSPRWTVDILADNQVRNAPFGMCGSPLVVDGNVVVCPGGKGASLVAYDQMTGARIWAAGDSPAAYSSPQLAQLGERPQILNFNADGLFAHDPASGAILWNYTWVTPPERNNVCQPICLPGDGGAPDEVLISSGYGKGCARLAIAAEKGALQVREIWTNKLLKCKFASAVARDRFVYGLDEGILTCIEIASGARRWKQGHYGHGQLLLAGDVLLVQAESGEVVLVRASPTGHRELARYPALLDRTWNHPVIAGKLLLVRNDHEAACFELPEAIAGAL